MRRSNNRQIHEPEDDIEVTIESDAVVDVDTTAFVLNGENSKVNIEGELTTGRTAIVGGDGLRVEVGDFRISAPIESSLIAGGSGVVAKGHDSVALLAYGEVRVGGTALDVGDGQSAYLYVDHATFRARRAMIAGANSKLSTFRDGAIITSGTVAQLGPNSTVDNDGRLTVGYSGFNAIEFRNISGFEAGGNQVRNGGLLSSYDGAAIAFEAGAEKEGFVFNSRIMSGDIGVLVEDGLSASGGA